MSDLNQNKEKMDQYITSLIDLMVDMDFKTLEQLQQQYKIGLWFIEYVIEKKSMTKFPKDGYGCYPARGGLAFDKCPRKCIQCPNYLPHPKGAAA